MKWRKVSSGSAPNFEYETTECCGQYLNVYKVLGPVGREERISVLTKALKVNQSTNYFSIVDNRQKHPDNMSYDDMGLFGDMFLNAGINRVHRAVVTGDAGYHNIVKLTSAVAVIKNVKLETLSTNDYKEAEKFILSRIMEIIDRK